jgi:multicomponent Na+:H+ antiporter subunit D
MKTISTEGAMLQTATAAVDWYILAPVVIPLVTAAILIIFRRAVGLHPYIALLALAANIYASFELLMKVQSDGPLAMTMGNWLPPFGISFTADFLGAILTMTSSLAVFCVALYGMGDASSRERRFGFYPLILTLLVGVNGSFLTGDIFNLYVWFEVFVISSFGLIVLGGTRKQLDGAVKYCFLSLIATTLFLIATGYLYGLYGTLNMADLSKIVAPLKFEGPLVVVSALYLLAFSMKAAAFPLYFWLPASYHTPKIVVSALFAGLLTKVGAYSLLRTFTITLPVAGDSWLMDVMFYVGVGTAICGSLGAVAQTDLRRLFSFLLVASIGFMLIGISIGTETALTATIFYMVHSILIMTALFLIAGVIYEHRGSLDLRSLSGMNKDLPLLSLLFLGLGFVAMGFPPFSGFWPKMILISETIKVEAYVGTFAIIFSSFLSIISLGRAFAFGFWRPLTAGAEDEVAVQAKQLTAFSKLQYVPVLLLMILVTLVGVLPGYLFDLSSLGAKGLVDTSSYIAAVFGGAL